jgi:hypothetical protein
VRIAALLNSRNPRPDSKQVGSGHWDDMSIDEFVIHLITFDLSREYYLMDLQDLNRACCEMIEGSQAFHKRIDKDGLGDAGPFMTGNTLRSFERSIYWTMAKKIILDSFLEGLGKGHWKRYPRLNAYFEAEFREMQNHFKEDLLANENVVKALSEFESNFGFSLLQGLIIKERNDTKEPWRGTLYGLAHKMVHEWQDYKIPEEVDPLVWAANHFYIPGKDPLTQEKLKRSLHSARNRTNIKTEVERIHPLYIPRNQD